MHLVQMTSRNKQKNTNNYQQSVPAITTRILFYGIVLLLFKQLLICTPLLIELGELDKENINPQPTNSAKKRKQVIHDFTSNRDVENPRLVDCSSVNAKRVPTTAVPGVQKATRNSPRF